MGRCISSKRTSKMRFTNNRLTNLRIFKLIAHFEKLNWRGFGALYLRSGCFIAVVRMHLKVPAKIPCCAEERQSRGFLEGTFKPMLLLYCMTAIKQQDRRKRASANRPLKKYKISSEASIFLFHQSLMTIKVSNHFFLLML